MIEIRNVSKKYKEKIALANCNLQIPKGQVIGLFGANGAGKTTFMKCIMGFLTFEGEITLDGKKLMKAIYPGCLLQLATILSFRLLQLRITSCFTRCSSPSLMKKDMRL